MVSKRVAWFQLRSLRLIDVCLIFGQRARSISLLSGIILLLTTAPVAAQFPIGECDPDMADPNAFIDPDLLTYCESNSDADCDLAITDWDPISYRSPDIRIGDAFDPLGPTPPEQVRFFLDPGSDPVDPSDDRLYTKLYTRFRNAGGGLGGGGPAPATEVTVDFWYKETNNPADASDPTGWEEAGTIVDGTTANTYYMNIPPPATDGVLFPGVWHSQQRSVCWSFPVGSIDIPKQFILKAVVNWGQDTVDTDNNIAYSFYDLTSLGRKAQIGFAFDLSGSMSATFNGSTRLEAARDKAILFTSLIEDGNQLGVFGFATNNPANSPFSDTYNGSDPPIDPVLMEDTAEISSMLTIGETNPGDEDRDNIADQISDATESAYGCTPIGQGLLRARNAINSTLPPEGPPTPVKAIVLFSDGLQNVPPVANSDPPYLCRSTPDAPIINTTKTFVEENVRIYSVYFGPGMGWSFDLMNILKDQTGGDFIYGAANDLEVAKAYYSIRGLLDDMIFFEDEAQTGTAAPWPTFEVEFDAAASIATVAVAWPYGSGETRLKIDRRLKGNSDWQSCETPQVTSASFTPKSFNVCRFMPGANTTWEFQVRQVQPRRGTTQYTAAVFSEVQEIRIFPSLDDTGFSTGDALPIRAELRSAGRPVLGAIVTADVRVPSRSFSTTLYQYADRFKDAPIDQDAHRVQSLATQLSQFLKDDEGSDAIYVYRNVPVTLRDDGKGDDETAGDGIYAGALSGTDSRIAGDYTVTIEAQATLAGGRKVERIAELATICNVGSADKSKTLVKVKLSSDPVGDTRIATVTVVPFDKYGNAAFPGSGRKISFTTVGATLKGSLVDNFDASYSQRFAFTRDDAKVTVVVDGNAVVSRPLVELPGAARELSLHLGVATPHGAGSTIYSSGPSIAADYAWRFNANFAVKAELALDQFDKKAGGSDNMTSLAAYFQYRRPAGQWQFYFESGAGVYDLESVDTAFGFAAGIGVRRELTPQWSVDLNLQGHWVGGNVDLSFSRIRAGGIYELQP